MSETPGFTFSPEGVLDISVTLENDEYKIDQLVLLDQLDSKKGIEVIDEGNVKVDVQEAFGHEFKLDSQAGSITNFLDTIGRLIPYLPYDREDRISHPLWIGPNSLATSVYPNFQRWLNTQQPLDESVAKDAIAAMAKPFGKKIEKDSQKYFRMSGHQYVNALHFDFAINPEEFTIRRTKEYDTHFIEQEGTVNWTWANISTIGSCACIGVNGDDRTRVNVSDNSPAPWLYEMTPHNIDISKQTLSLVMGIGTLTHKAAMYESDEDILADAAWNEGRRYDRIYP